jgi:hypothetical protein
VPEIGHQKPEAAALPVAAHQASLNHFLSEVYVIY